MPPFVQATRLVAFDGDRGENFGTSVAVSGNTLVVGSANARIGASGNREGAVYVYTRTATTWSLQQKLTASEGANNDHLGQAVAIEGNTIVAGAPGHRASGNPNEGTVDVFTRSGTTWTQRAEIAPSSASVGDAFGTSVALSGSTFAAGAPNDSTHGGSAGAVYVFTGSGSSWSQQAKLTASDGDRGDELGFSVALDGNTLMAGAPYRDDGGRDDEGSVYFYTRTGTVWTQSQRLGAAAPVAEDHLGFSVALDGTDAVAGMPGYNGTERDQGGAVAYAFSAGIWVLAQTVTAPASTVVNDAEFGTAVDVDGGLLAVGAPRNPGARGHQGVVYAFNGGQGVWHQRDILTVPEASENAHVGSAVTVDASTLVAGAPDDNIPERRSINDDQGSVSVFAELAAASDAYTINQGATLTVAAPGVLVNDANPSGGPVTAALASGPAHGTLTLNADGSFAYDPRPDFSGADSFTYRMRSGAVLSNAATVTITVRPRPVANPDVYTADQNTALTVPVATGVLANDVSGIGATLSAALRSGPAHGTVTLNADGSLTYTPQAAFAGTDTFTYTATDSAGTSAPATVTVTVVAPPLSPPVAANDAYSVDQDTVLTVNAATGVLANDVSQSPALLTARVLIGPAHGTLILNADGSFTYTPTADFTGPDEFLYQAVDPNGTSPAAVVINVRPAAPVLNPPVANPDAYAVDQNTVLTVDAATGVLANDTSESPAGLAASVITGPLHGTLTLNPNGSFTYTPNAGYTGPDTFRYQAADPIGTDQANVAINVRPTQPVVVPPTANPDSYSTDQDTALTATAATGVLANDLGSALTAAVLVGPQHGTLTLNADGSFTYTPTAGYSGPDSFIYQASNGAGTAQTTAAITVIPTPPVIPAPVAGDDSYSTDQDTALTAIAATGVLANDSGSALTASLITGPQHGTLTLNANGSFTYTPTLGYSGPDAFTYQAQNISGTSQGTASITVIPAPPITPAPVAADDSYATAFNAALTVDASTGVLANDTGPDLAATLITGPQHGTLSLNADGSFTYTPTAGYSGADAFTYQAANSAGTAQATAAITVHPRPNRPPVAAADTFTTAQDTPLRITVHDVLDNDSDPDGDKLTFASPVPLTNPAHGTINPAGPGAATYNPNPGFSGTDRFTYAVTDGQDNSAPATITITVTPTPPPNPDPGGGGGEIIVDPTPPAAGGGGEVAGAGDVDVPTGVNPGLDTCKVQIDTTVNHKRVVLATGTRKFHRRKLVAVRSHLSRAGERLVTTTPGAVPVTVRAVCRATRSNELKGKAAKRLLELRIQHIVTPPGSWVPDHARLTGLGRRFVSGLGRRYRPLNATRMRCDGYTARVPTSPVDAGVLSKSRARLVCRMLKQQSLRQAAGIVAHGSGDPIASNATEPGRAANRRVAVTVVFGRTTARSGRTQLRAVVAALARDQARYGAWHPPRRPPPPTNDVLTGA